MKKINLTCVAFSLLTVLLLPGCTTIPEESFSEEQVSMEFSSVLWSDEPRQGIDAENEKNYELYYRVGENYKPLDFGEGSLQRSQGYSGSVDMVFYSKVIKNGVVSYKYLNKVKLDSAFEKALIFVFRAYGGANCLLIDVSNLSLKDNYALFVNLAERDVEVRYDGVIEKIKYEGSHSRALKNFSSHSLKPISIWMYWKPQYRYLDDYSGEWRSVHRQDIDFTQGEPSLLIHYVAMAAAREKHIIDVKNDVKLLRNN